MSDLQGGLTNDELLAAWSRKLPCAAGPTDRELSAFALGVEVGFSRAQDLERSDWNRVHHALAKHGLHPGRTADHLADVIDRACSRVAVAGRLAQALNDLTDPRRLYSWDVGALLAEWEALK